MERTEVKSDKWYSRGKLATSLAALTLVLSAHDPFDKPEGPYRDINDDSISIDVSAGIPTELPAEFAPVIRLTDTLDGRLTTRGFQVFIDEWRVTRDLEPNEVAVFKQPHSAADEYTATEVIFASGEARQRMDKFFKENPKALDEFRSLTHSVFNASYDFLGEPYETVGNPGDALIGLGSGLEYHFDSQTEITYGKYVVKPSGLDLVSQQSTFVERIPNTKCDGADTEASVEVELTSQQRKVVCYVMERFGPLVGSETTLTLDSSLSRLLNSYDTESDDVLLSYPYAAGKEVPRRVFVSTALHEMMHAAYTNVEKDHPELHEAIDDVYADVVSTMRYEMPSWEVQIRSGRTVGEVEPVWGVITEGHYLGENKFSGHPWDEATEMIASAATVLAFHGDGFIERFKELSEKQQFALLQVVRVVGKVIETTDVSTEEVIPNYRMVLEQLQEIVE